MHMCVCVMFSVCCTHAEALTENMAVLFSYTETCLTLWSMQVQMFVEGEMVKILEDEHQVQELQKNHGEWTDIMRQVSSTVMPI